ncbi:hypothetical protein [Escherichia coli]|uniref:hypothetical protein n=1 Tax=Escherichia coli TaxID=562 RepID=UPI002FCCF935
MVRDTDRTGWQGHPSLSTEEDGIAYVTFEVFEAGERLFPSAADNTQQEVLTGIDAVKAAIDDGDWFGALDGLGEMADSFSG